jgi:malate dehydrogenase
LKVSVIGASGRVGKAAAFCLAEEDLVNKLVLISRERSLGQIEGEALDMSDALAAKDIRVSITSSCNWEDTKDSDIVVISAGIPRTADMNRVDLAIPNARIIAQYSKMIAKSAPASIILVITNPVDIMTYVAYKASGFPRNRVIGLGNHLDSLDSRTLLPSISMYMSERSTLESSENMEIIWFPF